jgi:hypothetical protein
METSEVGRLLAQRETLRGFQRIFFEEKITRVALLRAWAPEVGAPTHPVTRRGGNLACLLLTAVHEQYSLLHARDVCRVVSSVLRLSASSSTALCYLIPLSPSALLVPSPFPPPPLLFFVLFRESRIISSSFLG